MPRAGTVRKKGSRSRAQMLPPKERDKERPLLQVIEGEPITVLRFNSASEFCYCRNSEGEKGYMLMSQLDMEPSDNSTEGSLASFDDTESQMTEISTGTTSDLGGSIGDQIKDFYKITHYYQDPSELSLLIDAGELVKELPAKLEDPDGRVFVESCRTGCRGFVPMEYMERANELDSKPWFVGPMTRDDAECLLWDEALPDETFLVRESDHTVEGFVISIKTVDKEGNLRIRHRKIKMIGGRYSAWSSYSYRSVQELIRAHSSSAGKYYLENPLDKNRLPFNIGSRIQSPMPSLARTPSRPSFEHHDEQHPSFRPSTNNLRAGEGRHPDISPPQMTDYNPTQAYVYAPAPVMYSEDVMASNQPPLPPRHPPKDQPWPIQAGRTSVSSRTSGQENSGSAPALTHDKWYVSPDSIDKLSKLGAGHYGEVFKARFKMLDSRIMAMKTLNPKTMKVQDFMNEVNAMKELRHPFLVKLFGLCPDEGEIFMLMEFYPNGSIIDFLKNSSLSERQKQVIACNVSSGMSYLSEQNYIHRDLAARNVLLADDLSPRVADFGLAKHTKGSDHEQGDLKMPWKWTAPEALCGRRDWSIKCDVWSFGVFCWEMYTNCREKVYKDITRSSDLVAKLNEGFRMEKPNDCSQVIYQIILRCWDLNPQTRIAFQEIELELGGKKTS